LILAAALRGKATESFEFGGSGKSREAKELEARITRDEELKKMERKTALQIQLMRK